MDFDFSSAVTGKLNVSVKEVAKLLESAKQKDRQDGIAGLRKIFKSDRAVESLDPKGEGKPWLFVFQAVFAAALSEKQACIKKGIENAVPASLRRLEEVGSLLRWLTRRALYRINKKVAKALLTHLLQMLVHKGQLLTPIVDSYSKALRILLSHQPHLDNLDLETWEKLLSLSFAAVLGDPIHPTRGLEEDELEVALEVDEMDVDSSPAQDGKSPRKRPLKVSGLSSARSPSITTSSPILFDGQLEFVLIIQTLLQDSYAPYICAEDSSMAQAIMSKFRRFFHTYTTWTSGHALAISAMNAILFQLELNAQHVVSPFAIDLVDCLLVLWRSAARYPRDGLILSLKTLLPFIISQNTPDIMRKIELLDGLLEAEAGVSRGIGTLPLDTLRLHPCRSNGPDGPFEAAGIRSGFNFGPAQSLAWAICELHADCIHEILARPRVRTPAEPTLKRPRLERNDRIVSLFDYIASSLPSEARAYRLQLLHFFIARHWHRLFAEHDGESHGLSPSLHLAISAPLVELVQKESPDYLVRSWALLCLGALISTTPSNHLHSILDVRALWKAVLPKLSSTELCRGASHVASVLLDYGALQKDEIMPDIETFARNLSIQGPPIPYDSICRLFTQLIRFAHQDIRLHKLHLEDAILGWLTERWRFMQATSHIKIESYTVGDILELLATACGLERKFNVICTILLPDDPLTERMVNVHRTQVIRKFFRHGELPLPQASSRSEASSQMTTTRIESVADAPVSSQMGEHGQPRANDRKASSFLLKCVESMVAEWDISAEILSSSSFAKVRATIDLAVLTLAFETSLNMNGIRFNSRLLKLACQLVGLLAPAIESRCWTQYQRAMILLGLEPLINPGSLFQDVLPWEAILPAGSGSGIGHELLVKLAGDHHLSSSDDAARKEAQSLLWASVEFVYEGFQPTIAALRRLLEAGIGGDMAPAPAGPAEDDDDKDFTKMAPEDVKEESVVTDELEAHPRATAACVFICTAFWVTLEFRRQQEMAPGPWRDGEVADLLLDSDADNTFFLLAPALFESLRRGELELTSPETTRLLERINDLAISYSFSRSARLQQLVLHMLSTLTPLLLRFEYDDANDDSPTVLFQDTINWFMQMIKLDKMRSWEVRDQLAQFLDLYVRLDPELSRWQIDDPDQTSLLPAEALAIMTKDPDARVRFRVAVASARVMGVLCGKGSDPNVLYSDIRLNLCADTTNHERMLTRFLALGNYMVVNSSVRRGPYWHLLETEFYTDAYTQYVEAVLRAVAAALGFATLSSLFESHATHIAHVTAELTLDFTQLAPRLLGYRDIRDFMVGAFPLVCPMLALRPDCEDPDVLVKQGLFLNYTRTTHHTTAQALAISFPAIVGWSTAFFLERNIGPQDQFLSDESNLRLMSMIDNWARKCLEESPTEETRLYALSAYDRIIFNVLRLVQDIDYSPTGPIVAAVAVSEPGRAQVFNALNVYRSRSSFEIHQPNPPHVPTITITRCFKWLASFFRQGSGPRPSQGGMVYHVTRLILAAIDDTTLVNEQLRLINALCIHISYHYKEIMANTTLLRILMHGAMVMLAKLDLAYAAQSILNWTIDVYGQIQSTRKSDQQPSIIQQFPDILSATAQQAARYSKNSLDATARSLGLHLTKWIVDKATQLFGSDHIRPQLLTTIPLWPPTISATLKDVGEDLETYDNLFFILSDPRTVSNKFRIIQRLRNVSVHDERPTEVFPPLEFWLLKACIPTLEEMDDDDVSAFVDLLRLRAGHIQTIIEDPTEARLLGLHRWLASPGGRIPPSALQHLITSLSQMLSSQSLARIDIAYKTLRNVFAAGPAPSDIRINSDALKELRYIASFPLPKASLEAASLQSLATDPKFTLSCSLFSEWISSLTMLLSNVLAAGEAFYGNLAGVLATNIEFAQEAFPLLVHAILLQTSQTDPDAGKATRKLLSEYFAAILHSPGASTACKQSIINLVLHLRHRVPSSTVPMAYNHWLELDFLLFSKAAVDCEAFATALLFLELAADKNAKQMILESSEDSLYEIYSHVEDPDGFYAIKSRNPDTFLLRRLHHERRWDKALQFHSAGWSNQSSGGTGPSGVAQSLHHLGWGTLALQALQSQEEGFSKPGKEASNMMFDLGWRTGHWDLPLDGIEVSSSAALYSALRAVHRERDSAVLNRLISQLLRKEVDHLKNVANEDMVAISECSRALLSLQEVRQWCTMESTDDMERTFEADKALMEEFDFEDFECLTTSRLSVLHARKARETSQQIGDLPTELSQQLANLEQKCLIQLSAGARRSGKSQAALNAVSRARSLGGASTFNLQWEHASVLWMQGEHNLAVDSLKALLYRLSSHPNKTPDSQKQRPLILAQLGDWVSQAGLEQPGDILKRYFQPAVEQFDKISSSQSTLDDQISQASAFNQYALFAEHQYQLSLQSPEYERRRLYMERMEEEVAELRRSLDPGQTRDNWVKKSQDTLNEDRKLFTVLRDARFSFLLQAIDMFARCLIISDKYSEETVIRLCSLWFSNFFDDNLNRAIEARLLAVPSHKFIFLSHQLSSRLSHDQQHPGQDNLRKLLRQLCNLHPFHTVYQIYALIQGSPPPPKTTSRRSRAPAVIDGSPQADRSQAALSLLQQLESYPNTGQRVKDVHVACDAFIEFAQWSIPKGTGQDRAGVAYPIPSTYMLPKLQHLKIPIVTDNVEIDPTGKYDNIVYLQRYQPKFTLAGGVNLPKIIECEGSDGEMYKQLFKGQGEDDIRQDAVMEQVFQLVNILLVRDQATRKRQLRIRTYKVIPLAPKAGVLEFVRNTVPLISLVLNGHKTFRPKDMKDDDARTSLMAAKGNPASQLKTFQKIREKLKPVMRHVFSDQWKSPMTWYKRRLNYTRSVATTSIIGHVIGLGDRHLSNILLDSRTGEVVHIDLGIAFDQGRALPMPEMIPFRLTADIVDGMGIMGTEGVFQRCAEETLRVLREESNVIMTVLEVFKTDPLHSWTASAVRIRRAQHDSNPQHQTGMTGTAVSTTTDAPLRKESDKTEEQADRALSAVRQKLDKSLSVSHNVNELISQATDVVNLSRLFVGWRPWL